VKPGTLPAGFIDAARDDGSRLILRGWMLSKEGDACTVEAIGPDGVAQVAERIQRPDVVRTWPNAARARDAGFSLALPADKFALSGRYSFELHGRCGDETIFACPITRPLMHLSCDLGPSRWNDGVLDL
jgi:hypothetical protein